MSYRDFDFEIARKESSNPRRITWLEENFDKPISEKEYVEQLTLIRGFSKSKHNSGVYSPSSLKQNYRKLKEIYGFFQ